MSAADFAPSLSIILKEEGGNDDDPRDHGGRTSRGITQREWDVFRESHPDRPSDVWQAPQTDIEEIYRRQYWNPYCDQLPAGVDLEFFNASVNSGRQQAVRELQRALGVQVDGMMGMITLNAVNECKDIPGLVRDLAEKRRAFYQALAQYPIYGKGWMSRTNRVEMTALMMAKGSASAAVATHPDVDTVPLQPEITISAKATPTDTAKPPLSQQTASVSTAASSVLSGLSDQLQTVSSAIQPLSETFQYVKYICIGIAVICAGLAIYAVIHNNRIKEAV